MTGGLLRPARQPGGVAQAPLTVRQLLPIDRDRGELPAQRLQQRPRGAEIGLRLRGLTADHAQRAALHMAARSACRCSAMSGAWPRTR